jgi:hypothetical protein
LLEKYAKDPQISLNWSLIFFLGIYLGFIWQKNHFHSKQNCQNRLKGVLTKQPLRPKISQQKSNQPNKG